MEELDDLLLNVTRRVLLVESAGADTRVASTDMHKLQAWISCTSCRRGQAALQTVGQQAQTL